CARAVLLAWAPLEPLRACSASSQGVIELPAVWMGTWLSSSPPRTRVAVTLAIRPPGRVWVPAIKEEHQARGRESPCADRPIGDMARDHKAGGKVEPHAARMGELLPSRNRQQGVSGARQPRSSAVAPVVALQAQGQAEYGRSLSTLASL